MSGPPIPERRPAGGISSWLGTVTGCSEGAAIGRPAAAEVVRAGMFVALSMPTLLLMDQLPRRCGAPGGPRTAAQRPPAGQARARTVRRALRGALIL